MLSLLNSIYILAILSDDHIRVLDRLRDEIMHEMQELNALANVRKKPETYLFDFQNSTLLESFGGFDLVLDSQDTSQFAGYETEVAILILFIFSSFYIFILSLCLYVCFFGY
jgi:hypothetical protein